MLVPYRKTRTAYRYRNRERTSRWERHSSTSSGTSRSRSRSRSRSPLSSPRYKHEERSQRKRKYSDETPRGSRSSTPVPHYSKHGAADVEYIASGECGMPLMGTGGTGVDVASGQLTTSRGGIFGKNTKSDKWIFPQQKGDPQKTIMSARTYRVGMGGLTDLYRIIEHDAIYNFVKNKLWSSICPGGLDMSFGSIEGEMFRPHPWFADNILNDIWLFEIKRIFWSLLAAGYAVVVMGPNLELENEITPRVIDPLDCTLEWKVDSNGKRYYTARPVASRIPITDATKREFEFAKVFVIADPTPNGDLTSRARSCQENIVFLQQATNNYRIIDHSLANMPFVVENNVDKQPPPWSIFGNKTVPDTAMYPPFLNNPMSGGGGGMVMGGGGTMMVNCPPQTHAMTAERAIGVGLYAYSSAAGMRTRIAHDSVTSAHADASKRAEITSLRTVDDRTGVVSSFSPDVMWQRSLFPLPPGATVANLHMPEPPKAYVDVTRQKISEVYGGLGVPQDLGLGATGGESHVTTSTLSQEMLRATVRDWRNTLSTILRALYWRIYGKYHLGMVAADADSNGESLSMEEATDRFRSLKVVFRFRENEMNYVHAKQLFDDGVLSGKMLAKFAMEEYGLSTDEVIVPLTPQEMRIADALKKADSTRENYSDEGVMGDIGTNDIGSIGFSGYTRNPTRVDGPRV